MVNEHQKVGILGCGQMGSGIAEVCARAGIETVVREVSQELIDIGLARIRSSLERARERGKLKAEACDRAIGLVSGSLDVSAMAGCDLVIEAIVEDLEIKRKAISEVAGVLGEGAILATNSSSLTVTELAMSSDRPERFVGLHFQHHVQRIPREAIRGTAAAEADGASRSSGTQVGAGLLFVRVLGTPTTHLHRG